MENNFLNDEEQFEKSINIRDIERIKDSELRHIRRKYSNKRIDAFEGKLDIKKSDFCDFIEKTRVDEMKEIDEYRKRQKNK